MNTIETPRSEGKPVVLFLCTGNSARSQMAEAFLKKYARDRFEVMSAGMEARGIHPLTTRVMNEVGVDISGQHSKSLRQFLGRLTARFVIFVCAPVEPACPKHWPGPARQLSWPFEDPVAADREDEKLSKFRAVRDQIEDTIKRWLRNLQDSEEGGRERPSQGSQAPGTPPAVVTKPSPLEPRVTLAGGDMPAQRTLLSVLAKVAGYALLGGLAGSALGVPIGWGAGLLAGSSDGAVADGILIGSVLGALTGAVISDPIDSWPGKRWQR